MTLKLGSLHQCTRIRLDNDEPIFTQSSTSAVREDQERQKNENSQIGHLAPEIILKLYKADSSTLDQAWVRGNLATQSSDMWAVGCIFFNMLAGYHPF